MKEVIFILLILLLACQSEKKEPGKQKSHPSHKYTYVKADKDDMGYLETDYVPVYSDIYHRDGTRRFMLTTTISIRNTSLTDSAFIFTASYYDSYGNVLAEYIDSTVLLTPLESIEFVIDEKEEFGGAGANFIIKWGASRFVDQLLIQSIMISTYGQQGISFITDAKVIERKFQSE